MITVTAYNWVPDFAKGVVRDLRVRWALEEAGLPYQVRLITQEEKLTPSYRALQPLGSRARDHRDSMVGAVVLRPQAITRGTPRWNTLGREHDAALSTRGSLPKKDWSRTSTPCTRSARRV